MKKVLMILAIFLWIKGYAQTTGSVSKNPASVDKQRSNELKTIWSDAVNKNLMVACLDMPRSFPEDAPKFSIYCGYKACSMKEFAEKPFHYSIRKLENNNWICKAPHEFSKKEWASITNEYKELLAQTKK